jgi:chemotaxis protein CheD
MGTAAAPVRWTAQVRLAQTYLHPGQMHVTGDQCTLSTILGSCVAVCLYDPDLRMGGMNHFLLPNATSDQASTLRYGPSAMQHLFDSMTARGARANRIMAWITGGANVLAAFQNQLDHLGWRNVEVARDYLSAHGISVVGEDVGGSYGRKLVFTPHEGRAWIQVIRR